MRRLAACLPCVAALALGCGSEPTAESASAIFACPASLADLNEATFFDHPWPSDARIENGKTRFTGYYNPKAVPIVNQYIESMDGVVSGFSPVAAGFLRFDGPIDPSTLPVDPAAAMQASSSVQLIDIDPSSPEHGQRKQISVKFRAEAGVYWLPNTLAVMPTPGFPLRPSTRYALVATNALHSADGSPIAQNETLAAVLGGSGPGICGSLGDAVSEVEAAGISTLDIVHFTAFTTASPATELFQVADHVRKFVPAPTAEQQSWVWAAQKPTYDTYRGIYGPSPNFQAGTLPFKNYGDGGNFNFQDGIPSVVDTFSLRFSLSVPKAQTCPMPANGYPVVLYAHGTGGDFESYIADGTARELSQRCLASMGVDQIFHGTRPGAPVSGDTGTIQLLFFNVENPVAARTNPRQGAIDEVQRTRLFTETKIKVPASVSTTGQEIQFDSSKVLYFGHSQGGLSGPLFLASDSAARGGVLSGSSAIFAIALLEKTEPSPSIKNLVATIFLSLSTEEAAELDLFHPAISMAQAIVDVTDPINYARMIAAEPRPTFASKSIYMTEGINPDGKGDSYSPPAGIEAHSVAMGLPLQLPGQHPIVQTAWGGPQPVTVPPTGLSGNLANGQASGIIAQWPISAGDDGHFVVFDQPKAADQAAEFLKNLAADPKGKVPAP
ncbi:MAG: hypothetical protein IPK82_37415 [Polyangiaceae bacterium]|nr:hypothetical protein [Polyangiaceae bacterium]